MSGYEFDKSKSELLRKERGLGFEDIIPLMESGCVVKVYDHPNWEQYPGQKVNIVNIDGYAWLVISEIRGDKIRLVTIYQSRKATKRWLKEFENDEYPH